MVVDAVLLPLRMFEDFIRYAAEQSRGIVPETKYMKLSAWLEAHSIEELIVQPKAPEPSSGCFKMPWNWWKEH